MILKGQFTYKNKKFKYKFSVVEWDNYKGFGAIRIDYKYKSFQIGEFFYINRNSQYENLLHFYENMGKSELKKRIEDSIIEHYNKLELKKKWS